MSKIEIKNIYKIFGTDPLSVLPMVQKGASKEQVLEETDIFVTPGTGYCTYGEGYIRLSLTVSDDQLDTAVDRLSSWKIPGPKL